MNGETENRLNKQTKCKEEVESQTEQVIWRLERLLGDTCTETGLARQVQPPSDSICTEDFHRCFREEMVEPALFETNMHQLDIEEDAEGTEVTDSDNCQSEQDGHVFNFESRGSALTEQNSKNTMSACYSKSDMPHQRKEPENYFSVQIPRRSDDNTSSKYYPVCVKYLGESRVFQIFFISNVSFTPQELGDKLPICLLICMSNVWIHDASQAGRQSTKIIPNILKPP